MKNRIGSLFIVLSIPLLAGCLPEERIVWSPDGRRAAVASTKGLYLIDPDGRVLDSFESPRPTRCGWFPDGHRIAVVHYAEARNWSDVADTLTEDQQKRARGESKALEGRIMAHEGSWDDFDLDPHDELTPGLEIGTLLYLRDHAPDAVKKKVGENWEDLEKLTAPISILQVFDASDDRFTQGPVLARCMEDLRSPRVSPNGRNVAVLRSDAVTEDAPASLYVVPASGGALRLVARNVSFDYAWSPDSTSLALIRSASAGAGGDTIHLGSLTTVTIADSDGTLLDKWTRELDRAGLLFDPALGVHWLRDGRLLFSSVEVHLPATSRDMPQQWSLFVLDPRMPAGIARAVARDLESSLDPQLPLFKVSPDETRVALPGPKGRLYLYEFASGGSTEIVGVDDLEGKTRCLPSWRNPSELTLVRPRQEEGRVLKEGEVVIWKDGKARVISRSWPDAIKRGWLAGES